MTAIIATQVGQDFAIMMSLTSTIVLSVGLARIWDCWLRFIDFVSKTNQVDDLVVAILGPAFGLSFIANQLGKTAAAGASLQS